MAHQQNRNEVGWILRTTDHQRMGSDFLREIRFPMRRSKKPMPIPQWEFGFTAEAFNLTCEVSADGERITRERAECEQAKRQAEEKQIRLFTPKRF